MKKHFIIFYIAFIQFAVLPFVKTYKDINKKESLLSKLPETTINNKDDSKKHIIFFEIISYYQIFKLTDFFLI